MQHLKTLNSFYIGESSLKKHGGKEGENQSSWENAYRPGDKNKSRNRKGMELDSRTDIEDSQSYSIVFVFSILVSEYLRIIGSVL